MRCPKKVGAGNLEKTQMRAYVYVTPFFPDAVRHDGSYCFDFAKSINGYDRVAVFVPGGGADYDFNGVHVYRFPTKALPSNALPFLYDGVNVCSFMAALQRAGIRPSDVAVAHANVALTGIFALAIKKLNPKCLTVLHHHDLRSFGFSIGRLRHCWLHKLTSYFYFRNIHERIDLHVFISSAAERSFRSFPDTSWSSYDDYRKIGRGLGWLRKANIKRSMVVHNMVDPALFNATWRVPRNDGKFRIGTAGNLIDVKDHISLIKAVERLRSRIPNIELELLGTKGWGPHYRRCCEYIDSHGLGNFVHFTANVKHDEMSAFYRNLDLFVLPSYFEGFGCVLTESYACGTPFVAASGQGVDDLLDADERDRWTFPPRDVDALAEHILSYYDNRWRQRLSGAIYIKEIMSAYLAHIKELQEDRLVVLSDRQMMKVL